ncbi:hypothetical protein R0J87_23145, partial [Halomonas sp. SIMBA_159]
ADTGRPLDFTQEQKGSLDAIRGKLGEDARDAVYRAAIEDKDGDAIGAIVAANAPHAVNAARQMEGPGSVADFESLVYAGVNK